MPLTRLKSWAGLLARFLSVEVLIQAVGFTAGVLLVRVLPKTEYAFFTIANTMQQTMNTLADNGITSGLTAIGGRWWHDRFRFGQLINTAMRLRRTLALFAVIIGVPILAWLIVGAGASATQAAMICGAVLVALYFQITVGALVVAPLLHLQADRVQQLNLWSAVLRLALLLAAYALFLNAFVALLSAAVSFALQERMLRRWLPGLAETEAARNAQDRREILTTVKRQAPNTIYYCLQTQLSVWLISIFGNATAVADVGALGRVGMIFLVLSSLVANVVMPRFARIQEPRILWARYWQIIGGLGAVLLALLGLSVAFPQVLLWILGPQYAHLEAELLLMVLATVLGALLGTMYQLNSAKGWIVAPWLLIPIGAATEILLIVTLDVSQVRGVLLLAALSTIPGFLLHFLRTREGIRDTERALPP